MGRASRVVTGIGLVGLLALASGCAGPLSVAEPPLSGPAVQTCATLLADLPATVDGQRRRTTEPGKASAAWGNPAIVLTCGAAVPPEAGPDAQCFEVNDVGWYAEPGDAGWTFTTLGRAVPVQVWVPAAYAPEANALVDLARPITDHSPELQPCV